MDQCMKCVLAAVVTGVSLGAGANVYRSEPVTAVWVGGASGSSNSSYLWENAKNWRIEGATPQNHPDWFDGNGNNLVIPGVFTDSRAAADSVNCNGHRADQVIFDETGVYAKDSTKTPWAKVQVACKAIETTGLQAISNLTIRTPHHLFFSASGASFSVPILDGGTLAVEEGAGAPVLQGFTPGAYATHAYPSGTIRNDGVGQVYITYPYGGAAKDPEWSGSLGYSYFYIAGKGDLTFCYNTSGTGVILCDIQTGGGQITFCAPWKPATRLFYVERPDNSKLVVNMPNVPKAYDGDVVTAYHETGIRFADAVGSFVVKDGNSVEVIAGEHQVVTIVPNGSGYAEVTASGSSFIDMNANVSVTGSGALRKSGAGTLRLSYVTNGIPGNIELYDGWVETDRVGMKGVAGPLGIGSALNFVGTGGYRYLGAGETTDRGIKLTSSGAKLDNSGTGGLTFNSAATAQSSGNNLLVIASGTMNPVAFTAPLTDNGSAKLGFQVKNGVLAISGANTCTAASSVFGGAKLIVDAHDADASLAADLTLKGGALLEIQGGATSVRTCTLASLRSSADKDELSVTIKGKANLCLGALTLNTGAAIAITTDEIDNEIVWPGKTSSAAVPAGIKINGVTPAAFDDNGHLIWKKGKVSGAVDVIHTGNYRLYLDKENDYTGRTVLDGAAGGTIYAALPASIPEYLKVEASIGNIVVPASAWTDAQILSLANAGTYANGSVVAVNTALSGERQIVLQDAQVTGDSFGLGAEGPSKVTVTGASVTKAVNLSAVNGTLEVKDATVRLGRGEATVMANGGNMTVGTIVFDNVKGTLANDAKPISVGGYAIKRTDGTVDLQHAIGRMTVKDSTLDNCSPSSAFTDNYNFAIGGLNGAGRGLVEILGDSVVTGQFCIAGRSYKGSGGVVQRGSRVTNRGSTRTEETGHALMGYQGSGSWELFDGDYVQLGTWGWANNQAALDAQFLQHGGTSLFTPYPGTTARLFFGGNSKGATTYRNGGHAVVYVDKGVSVFSNICIRSSDYPYGYTEFTANGAEAEIRFRMVDAGFAFGSGADGSRVVITMANGGKFSNDGTLNLYGNSQRHQKSNFLINMNGGVYENVSSVSIGDATRADRNRGRITVFEKGGTFRTAGNNTLNVYMPISAPTGKGVKSIRFKDTINGLQKFVSVPRIWVRSLVDGSTTGDAATAIAQFDYEKGAITNVVVTCPGWDQPDTPTVETRYAMSIGGSAHIDAVETETLVGGGIVKEGVGTLRLMTNNTYVGATTVKEGTLFTGAAYALPNGNELRLVGGSVDFGEKLQAIGSLYLSGNGTISGAENVTWPQTFTIDASQKAGYKINGPAALPAGLTLDLVGAGSFDKKTRYTLLTLDDDVTIGGSLTEAPTVTGLDGEWVIRRVGNSIRASVPRGMNLIIR